jgi:hypothetical protein
MKRDGAKSQGVALESISDAAGQWQPQVEDGEKWEVRLSVEPRPLVD